MNVGLVFDLRQEYLDAGFTAEEAAEFDRPDTICAIESALTALGYRVERVGNAYALVQALAQGRRWDLVFNIAEGLYGYGREALVPALLDAWSIPYVFSDPLTQALTLHKGAAKHVVRDLGLPTPDFVVVEREEDIDLVDLPFPLFAKPVAEGTGKGVGPDSRVLDLDQLRRVCRTLLEDFRQPVLVETYLPGREFTVGVVGTGPDARVVGVMELVLNASAEAGAYTYLNKEECEELVTYRLARGPEAEAAARTALASYRGLGARDGGRVDLRMDGLGVPHFIEINPLAGLHPEHSDLPILCTLLGIPYQDLIGWIMASAEARLDGRPGQAGLTAAERFRTVSAVAG